MTLHGGGERWYLFIYISPGPVLTVQGHGGKARQGKARQFTDSQGGIHPHPMTEMMMMKENYDGDGIKATGA